jgi:Ca2+-transporting ATPase
MKSARCFSVAVYQLDEFPDALELVRAGRRSRRWRFRSTALRRPLAAASLAALLRTLPEVAHAEADARSGSVLLVTRHDRLPPQLRAVPSARPHPRSLLARLRRERQDPLAAAWHALPVDEVFRALDATPAGLSQAEARRRLRRYGLNALEPDEVRSRLAVLAAQLANVPAAMLLTSSALSSLLGELLDAAAILSVVGVNTAIGYSVERANERLIASWRQAEAGVVEVVRDGQRRDVSIEELVPGDLLHLRAGDVVPADARVFAARGLTCDEAPLTGESEPQPKAAAPVTTAAPLADRTSMLYAGTTVAAGTGRAVIVATGLATELAGVRRLVEQSTAPPTPLAQRLDRLSNRVARLSVIGAAASALASLAHGRPLARVVRGAVALGVAALPEGLPVVSTAALVRSMARMRTRGMVVRRVSSAETLGGVTVICTDKTGTLTQNRMEVELVDFGRGATAPSQIRARPGDLFGDRATLLLAAALLNSDVDVQRRGHDILSISGSSTEQALVRAALAAGLDGNALRRAYPTLALDERRPGVHYVVSTHGTPDGSGGRVAFVKGAPEQVVALCDGALGDVLAHNERLASDGLRVLAVAWRPLDGADVPRAHFRYLGLIALRDPLRPGAAAAIADARRAGIRTLIVTGDQRRTAEAIARQLGLDGEALDGADVAALARSTDPGAQERLRRLAVVSRVTPADKLAVVEALRARRDRGHGRRRHQRRARAQGGRRRHRRRAQRQRSGAPRRRRGARRRRSALDPRRRGRRAHRAGQPAPRGALPLRHQFLGAGAGHRRRARRRARSADAAAAVVDQPAHRHRAGPGAGARARRSQRARSSARAAQLAHPRRSRAEARRPRRRDHRGVERARLVRR